MSPSAYASHIASQHPNKKAVTGMAIGTTSIVVLGSLFRWTLVDLLTPFLELILEMAIGLLFLSSLLWSLVHFVRFIRRKPNGGIVPLAINVATALVVVFVPFTLLTTNVDFRVLYSARMSVVGDVLAGKYDNQVENAGGRGDLIRLRGMRSYLSSGGGEIVRLRGPRRALILFFDFRGVLDSFSGFVYSSDDQPPGKDDFLGNFVEIERLKKNWFWVASRN
jgi:hypothetical protein